jgi:dienelactone hydrolase
MSASEIPDWERRVRAPTITLPHWSPLATDRCVLMSDESGSFQAYAWDRATGDRRLVTEEPVGVTSATVSADGAEVIWFSDDSGDESGRWLAQPFEDGDVHELLQGSPIGWPDGLSVGRGLTTAILADRGGFAIHVAPLGEEAREIFRHPDRLSIGGTDFHLEGSERAGLSRDEALLCVNAAQDDDNIHTKLLVLDPCTGDQVAEIADGPSLALDAYAWSPIPGDQRLAILHEREDRSRPAIWDPVTGERSDLAFDLPGEVIPVDWWPDAGSLLVTHLFRGRHQLYRYELATGSLTEVLHPRGEIHGARVRPDGCVWLRVSNGHAASSVLDDRGRELLRPVEPGLRSGRPYHEWMFRGPGDVVVHGWLVTPPGEGPFPVYLKVHGGPSWLYHDTWCPDVQMLVDHGYAVGMANYRGSIGYGRSWRDAIIGNIGFPEVEDTVAGLDDLIARGIADPDRAVIGGWSWGGYTTLLALGTHPDRWVAGVAGVPVGDYAESYDDSAPSLQAYDRSLLGGTVHEVPDLVRERSPISYVDRVSAPVLVLVGDHDTRCVPGQVYSYVDALRRRGGEVEVYAYETGHSSYVVDEEVRQWHAVLDFLLRHVPES